MAMKIPPVATLMGKPVSGRRTPAREGCTIFLLLGLITILLMLILILPVFKTASPWLPVAMHSILHADYSVDQHPNIMPPASLGLIGDMLRDVNPSQAPERLSTVISALESSVPTVTPYPGETLLPTSTAMPLQPTFTQAEPQNTPTWTPKPSSTSPARSSTPLATTPIPTNTPTSPIWETLPATRMPSPTHSPATKTPTNEPTEKPPTQPAVTVPRPTPTNPPPTNPPPTKPPPTNPPPTKPPPTEPPASTPYPPPPHPTKPPPTPYPLPSSS